MSLEQVLCMHAPLLLALQNMSWSTASSGSQIAFGILATGISIVTIWQGQRFWKLWKEHHSQLVVSADIELGIPSSHSPCHDQDQAQTAVSSAAITDTRPCPAPLNNRATSPFTEKVAQSGEPISPLDLNDGKGSVENLADLFEAYVMIPRMRSNPSCVDLGLSPRSKPALSYSLRDLDGIRIATPASELYRYEHDDINCINIGNAATNGPTLSG